MGRIFSQEEERRRQAMQDAVDAQLGAVSFSGADIKAVVYMPVSQEDIRAEKESIYNELARLRETFEGAIAESQTLTQELSDAQSEYNNASATRSTYDQGSAEWLYWDTQVKYWGREIRLIADKLQKLNTQYPPGKLEAIRNAIVAADRKYKRYESLNLDATAGGSSIELEVSKAIVLGNLQTLSYSSHREKFPVRTLGRVFPKSYTRGPRTVAGSMIFTVINKHCLWELLNAGLKFYNTGVRGSEDHGYAEYSTVLVDQLPPFDITLLFSNELGDNSYMVLYGVEIVNEGQTMSIQDILTENTMQFVARDIDPLRPIWESRRLREPGVPTPKTAEDILKSTSAERRKARVNPFI